MSSLPYQIQTPNRLTPSYNPDTLPIPLSPLLYYLRNSFHPPSPTRPYPLHDLLTDMRKCGNSRCGFEGMKGNDFRRGIFSAGRKRYHWYRCGSSSTSSDPEGSVGRGPAIRSSLGWV